MRFAFPVDDKEPLIWFRKWKICLNYEDEIKGEVICIEIYLIISLRQILDTFTQIFDTSELQS